MLQIQKYYLFPLYYSLLANEALLTLVPSYTSMPLTVSTMKVEKSTGGKPTLKSVKRYRIQLDFRRCYRARLVRVNPAKKNFVV